MLFSGLIVKVDISDEDEYDEYVFGVVLILLNVSVALMGVVSLVISNALTLSSKMPDKAAGLLTKLRVWALRLDDTRAPATAPTLTGSADARGSIEMARMPLAQHAEPHGHRLSAELSNDFRPAGVMKALDEAVRPARDPALNISVTSSWDWHPELAAVPSFPLAAPSPSVPLVSPANFSMPPPQVVGNSNTQQLQPHPWPEVTSDATDQS